MCRNALALSALAALVVACGPPPEQNADPVLDGPEAGCAYPVTDRMAVAEPMPAMAWAEARDAAGAVTRLDLAEVHHDQALTAKLLAFVAVPSW